MHPVSAYFSDSVYFQKLQKKKNTVRLTKQEEIFTPQSLILSLLRKTTLKGNQ